MHRDLLRNWGRSPEHEFFSMARIGYVRISPNGLDWGAQSAGLRAAGCKIVHPVSATTANGSEDGIAAILDVVSPGDELVVVSLDRLAQSTRNVLKLLPALEAKKVTLTVLDPPLSTKDAPPSRIASLLAMGAEMERNLWRERQQVGIEAAKRKGVYRGRKPTVPADEVRAMFAAGHGPTNIARKLGISRMYVYRLTKGMARPSDGKVKHSDVAKKHQKAS
jgi:DNA invertase Pin-like site-specific DNA recombinase